MLYSCTHMATVGVKGLKWWSKTYILGHLDVCNLLNVTLFLLFLPVLNLLLPLERKCVSSANNWNFLPLHTFKSRPKSHLFFFCLSRLVTHTSAPDILYSTIE